MNWVPELRGTEDKKKGSVMKEVFDLATNLMLLPNLNLPTSQALRTYMACSQTLTTDGFERLWPGNTVPQTTENLKTSKLLGDRNIARS